VQICLVLRLRRPAKCPESPYQRLAISLGNLKRLSDEWPMHG
jgi:hypothetical protein